MTARQANDGVKGADRLGRRLIRLRRSASHGAEVAAAETAGEIRKGAQGSLRRMPGDLPGLADDVAVEGEGQERGVVVRHPAARFVEFGTRHMPPRPFLQPAADAARPSFRERMKTVLQRLLRRHA